VREFKVVGGLIRVKGATKTTFFKNYLILSVEEGEARPAIIEVVP
jgi:hypothetical protein